MARHLEKHANSRERKLLMNVRLKVLRESCQDDERNHTLPRVQLQICLQFLTKTLDIERVFVPLGEQEVQV